MGGSLRIEVLGTGVAASCCYSVLANSGATLSGQVQNRARVPAILVSPGTQQLLEDVFQKPGLLQGLSRIRRRIVAWGSQPARTLPHSGIVVSEQELVNRLIGSEPPHRSIALPDWTIHTGGPLLDKSTTLSFGSRTATATCLELADCADSEACVTESVLDGWLFLLPTGGRNAVLLTAGSSTSALIEESQIVRPNVKVLLQEAGTFPSHPRISDPLCGPGWLACGSAAIGFNPLCGDGTGHAIRSSVLACAVASYSSVSACDDQLFWEYRLRLWRGFRRHLELCLRYYESGGDGPWWRAQCADLHDGIRWLSERRSPYSLGQFQLDGFTLQRTPMM